MLKLLPFHMTQQCVLVLNVGSYNVQEEDQEDRDSGILDFHQQAISACDTAAWNQPSGSPGHTLPIVLYKTSVHHYCCISSHLYFTMLRRTVLYTVLEFIITST